MNDNNEYSTREINLIIDPIKRKLDLIHKQVITTNGRVTGLERWKSYMQGGMTVLSIIVVPLVVYVVRGWIT